MHRLTTAARLCVVCTAKRPQTLRPSINQSIQRIQTNFTAFSLHTSSLARADDNKETDQTVNENESNDAVQRSQSTESAETIEPEQLFTKISEDIKQAEQAIADLDSEIEADLQSEKEYAELKAQLQAKFDALADMRQNEEIDDDEDVDDDEDRELTDDEKRTLLKAEHGEDFDVERFLELEKAGENPMMVEEHQDLVEEEVEAENEEDRPSIEVLGYDHVAHEDGSVEFEVNPRAIMQHFDDPTAYSDDIDHIDERLEYDQPLTTTQKITLMKKWLADIEADPRTAFKTPQPMITWTHPTEPGARPDFHPPRMTEKFVEYDFNPEIVKSMSAESIRKARRGTVSEWILERKVYENKMHDVRKFYMAEYHAAKERREAQILREWMANKASKELRLREKKERQMIAQIARREREKAEFEQRLLAKRERAAARIHREAQTEDRKARILARMLQERKQAWINTDSNNTNWGVKIDDSLFHKVETNLTGFWPIRKKDD